MIQVENVSKSFGAQKILDGLNLSVDKGKTTVIIGGSGGGKSVLLKHLIGLLHPDSGRVMVMEKDMARLSGKQLNQVRRRFGMLFQEAALFDSMTVGENVAFPLKEHTKIKSADIRDLVEKKLLEVGLSNVSAKLPGQLSGGMRKRVGLARALALDPDVIIFDEPTTGLDPIMTDAINKLIASTQKRTGATCVVISHDIAGAFKIADRIAMLYGGRIIETGTPDQIRQTGNPVVRQFIEGRADGPIKVT